MMTELNTDSIRVIPRSPRCSTADNLLKLTLKDHYDVTRELGRGTYGQVLFAKCRETGKNVALKVLPKSNTKLREFEREFRFSYFLSPHTNVVDTYNVAFETRTAFVFAQEFAAYGDLFEKIPPQQGMVEKDVKNVIKQVSSALDFMHSNDLVHRDIKPENILIFEQDFSKIKLTDFGMTRKEGLVLRKVNGSIPYTPPEVCEAVKNESITVSSTGDVWAFGVLLFCMLTGNFPWENAEISDIYYNEFSLWQRRKCTKTPSQWRKFTPRILRFFRKTLESKVERRCNVKEIKKYLSDTWLKPSAPSIADGTEEEDITVDDEKNNQLTSILQSHGIDTNLDKRLRERRISEWLLAL
ncbi:serine/threonine-protein kinase SBK1-like [Pecten maximus]|uniref:serine/threonine-protein kinase SBK1-like n=1 Tax=Pecten maximus TaxID=6579 RepID=UPI001458EE7A|nr:serine/threonine-protein kinase SBK1-like [Pecten maximus]